MNSNRLLAGAALASFLSACSGYHGAGGGALPSMPSTLQDQAQRGAGAGAGAERGARLELALKIPKATKRRPNFISPSTQSIQIKEGHKTLGTFNTTPTSKGCLQQNGTTVCTFSMGAIPGKKQRFSIATYDSTGASGALLSNATIVQKIVASKKNTIKVTLNGVPKTIALALSVTSPTQGTPDNSITLTVTAQDADGNTIIAPGNYAHQISLADSNTSVATLTANVVRSPSSNVVGVHYTGAAGSATFTASATGVTNVTATLTSVKPHSQYVGGVWAVSSGSPSVAYYDNSSTAAFGLTGGTLSSPTAVAVDDVGGVIAGDASGDIEHWPINATGTATPSQTLGGANNVSALAWDPIDGRIIYAAKNTAAFCVVSSGASGALGPGNQSCYSSSLYPLASTISGLAVDPNNGTLYVANAVPVGVANTSGGYCTNNELCVSILVFALGSNGSYQYDHQIDMADCHSGYWNNVGQIAFDPSSQNSDGSVGSLWVADETPGNDYVAGVASSSSGCNINETGQVNGDGSTLAQPATVAWDGSTGL
ncbi:MAG TPA: hypothetical protein VNG31_10435, partial [Candidatus Baltobacteraceae bacterium]|nr:hypothetical protein [Candidatus Baltobacteraceae bacterium]